MKLGIVIGRFQPVHEGHIKNILMPAIEEMDHVLVLLGSSRSARNFRNPWTAEEREHLIVKALEEHMYPGHPYTVEFQALKDYPYSDNRWIYQVQHLVGQTADRFREPEIYLYGGNTDDSSYYLNLFPHWHDKTITPNGPVIHATQLRNEMFEKGYCLDKRIPESVRKRINTWLSSDEGTRISEEYEFVKQYKKGFESLPYPPIFQTVDNVVVWRGQVLLIQRRSHPGKGLWALPGGFLEATERIRDAAIRELTEETNIRTNYYGKGKTKLRIDPAWIHDSRTFDHPQRSLRGRTITTAFLWNIPEHIKVDIKAGSDAAKVQWFPLAEVLDDKYPLFEDHQAIIANLALNT